MRRTSRFTNSAASDVEDEREQEELDADEEEDGVVRPAEHHLAHLRRDGGREGADRVAEAEDVIAALPEAISTIIVSPMARPNPSTTAARTPGAAAGSTTRQAVSQRVAPSASDASR